MRDGKLVKADGKAWQGPREIRNLRWGGGEYSGREEASLPLKPDDFRSNFDDAIKNSLQQEIPR